MEQEKLIVFDCHGETRPAICFSLEVAGYDVRVMTNENEAINLLTNARQTEENFSGLVVNNPYLDADITRIVEDLNRAGIDIPVVFVKDSENFRKIVKSLALEFRIPRVFHAEPVRVVDLLSKLGVQNPQGKHVAGSDVSSIAWKEKLS